jgi:DNA-binding winged helix-turn-helix (wHTH) protein
LDLSSDLLLRDGEPVAIKGKTFETLSILARSEGRLVTREELMDALWPDSFVEENNLRQHISALRRLLGENADGRKYIETVPRRGYRFVPAVTVSGNGSASDEILAAPSASKDAELNANGDEAMMAVGHIPSSELSSFADTGAGAVSQPPPPAMQSRSIRRQGLHRGMKFLIWGIGVAFVFLVLLRVLNIYTMMTFDDQGPIAVDSSPQLGDSVERLLSLLSIPLGLGYFLGLWLIVYGSAKIIYLLSHRGPYPGHRSSLIEKFIVFGTIAMMCALAIPDMMATKNQPKIIREQQLTQPAR